MFKLHSNSFVFKHKIKIFDADYVKMKQICRKKQRNSD